MGPISLGALTATPNTILFIMKREFVNKSWIFCSPIAVVLRIHIFR
jgi:hypothetical protein